MLIACMPQLAGAALPAPRFHITGWEADQYFSAADDPDRTRMPWAIPSFLREKDPSLQKAETEELFVDKSSFARVVRNVLSEEDCVSLIASVNAKGFTPALLNIGGGRQQLIPGARDGHRVIVDSPELTDWLFQVLRPFLPRELEDALVLWNSMSGAVSFATLLASSSQRIATERSRDAMIIRMLAISLT